MGEAADIPKSFLKYIQDQSKPLLYSICLPTSVDYWICAIRNKVLESKSVHFLNNFHMLVSIPAYLQFCNDIISALHVFDIRQQYNLTSWILYFDNFWITSPACVSKTKKALKLSPKASLNQLPRPLWAHGKMNKNHESKNSFFSPGLFGEILKFQAQNVGYWPQLYTNKQANR